MSKALLQQWLFNYKLKTASNAFVVPNGELLHLSNPIGGFNEWTAVSYNLNVLANMMMENKKLHKELDDLVDRYVEHLEILAKIKPPAPAHPFPPPPSWPPQFPGYTPFPPYMYPGYPANNAANPVYPTYRDTRDLQKGKEEDNKEDDDEW